MILDKSWDHPSTPLFNELNWLPLQSRITYHVALLKSYHSNLTRQSLSTPIWNNIPEHMKSAITVNTFKSMTFIRLNCLGAKLGGFNSRNVLYML